MSRHDKLREKLLRKPKDFTYNELKTLLKVYGFIESQGNGSRVKFINHETKQIISLHKPHPNNELKSYQIDEIINNLKGYLS